MAKSKDAWSRFRERDEQRDEEIKNQIENDLGGVKPGRAPGASSGEAPVLDLIAKAEVMLEQIQNLYHMYISGLERLPPVTQRKLLEDIATKILAAPKPTAALSFRANSFTTKIQTYRDKWDKLMRDVESGKISITRKK
jgi:hypothetical protein